MPFDPISAVFDVGSKLIDRLWPDPQKKAEAQLELIKLQQSGELAEIAGQLEINKIEAGSARLFVSGWRPAVGWVCCIGLATQFLIGPFATWTATLTGHSIEFPKLDMGTLMTLLGGLLGLGTLRTYEKTQGVAAK
jgi:hypothetical protein